MDRGAYFQFCLIIGIITVSFSSKIDLGFLVDDWSIFREKFRISANAKAGRSVKNLIRNIYGSFNFDDDTARIGLVQASSTAKILFDFNTYNDLESINEAVERLSFPSKHTQSYIGKALELANYGLFQNTGRKNALKFLIIIAHRKSYDNVNRAAQHLKNSGVNILSVWSGEKNGNSDDLLSVVSPPKQFNLFRDNYNGAIAALAQRIVRRIRYVMSRTQTVVQHVKSKKLNRKWNGYKCSRNCEVVSMNKAKKVKIDCDNCKLMDCCDRCCKDEFIRPFYSGPVELAIILDESGELKSWSNFNTALYFIKNLTREFELSNKKTKINILAFSDTNLQVLDLHSYHDKKYIDAQINRVSYEGLQATPGSLNKALDAAQSNAFTGLRDLSIPRILLVFDSDARKDAETEIKAFKLQGTDVQTFCIGLGMNYDKNECKKFVQKPYKSRSLSAQVNHLSELQEAIMLMIVNDIAGKYCPLCAQGTSDACRPCKTSRNFIGGDDNEHMKPGVNHLNAVQMQLADFTSSQGNAKPPHGNRLQLLGANQVGTLLPSVQLIKDLLQTGTALNPDGNSQLPLIATGQNLGQQNPGQLSMQPANVPNHMQRLGTQQTGVLGGIYSQTNLPQTTESGEYHKMVSPILKSAPLVGNTGVAPLTMQPVALNPSLLSEALLRNAERLGPAQTENMATPEVKPTLDTQSNSLPPGSLSKLHVQNSDGTNQMTSSQSNVGITSAMFESLPPLSHVDTIKENKFHSPIVLPDLRLPMRLPAQGRMANWFGFPLTHLPHKKSQYDEYKYDLHDKTVSNVMDCKDLSDECVRYATEGGCDDFAPLSEIGNVQTMCRKSCGYCVSESAAVIPKRTMHKGNNGKELKTRMLKEHLK